jgi:hypothetical protein
LERLIDRFQSHIVSGPRIRRLEQRFAHQQQFSFCQAALYVVMADPLPATCSRKNLRCKSRKRSLVLA